jgi:hypothetical protein
LVIAALSAAGSPSRAMASLAVPMVADSVSEPAMTPAGRAGVVAEHPANQVGDDQPSRSDDRRQRRLLEAVASETAEELRPGPEPDRKQEEEEEALLHFARQLNAQLSDEDPGQQRAGDGAQREAPQLHLPDRDTRSRAPGRT